MEGDSGSPSLYDENDSPKTAKHIETFAKSLSYLSKSSAFQQVKSFVAVPSKITPSVS